MLAYGSKYTISKWLGVFKALKRRQLTLKKNCYIDGPRLCLNVS